MTPAPVTALGVYRASLSLDGTSSDAQAEPRSRFAVMTTPERLEDRRQVLCCNTGTRIANVNGYLRGSFIDDESYGPAVGVFDGVVEQAFERLPREFCVDDDAQRALIARRELASLVRCGLTAG